MKTNKNSEVQKMLSPEETSLLQDVMAGLQALLMSNNAGSMENNVEGTGAQQTPEQAPMAQKAGDPGQMETTLPSEEDDAQKSNDGPTANENAESRTESGTELTEDNLSSVAKALIAMANRGKSSPAVQKSRGVDDALVQTVMKAIQPIADKVSTLEKDMSSFLDAMGVSEAIETVEKAQNPMDQVNKSMAGSGSAAPVTNPDTMELIKMVAVSVANELHKGDTRDDGFPKPKYSTINTEAHKELGEAIVKVHKGA